MSPDSTARGWREVFAAALALFTILAVACDKPSADRTTSPSALALVGTATGAVTLAPEGAAPDADLAPDGWRFDLGNARFSDLERGAASIQVVNGIQTQEGATFEVWLSNSEAPIARWSGGETTRYQGTLCFQLRLESGDEALELGPAPYSVTIAFRDLATGDLIASDQMPVAGTPPSLDGVAPSAGSEVFRDLLGCPRSVI
ncbi:MAG TPA: hypothetical protein VFK32_00435 [Tepidiformaceae bacterium]|nr:hypothetical protein [Tepidiformaceae bacterium]